MTSKSLGFLAGAAVLLGVAAYFVGNGSKHVSPQINGKVLLPGLDISQIASVAVDGNTLLSSGEKGWKVDKLYGYPADRAKIAENLIKVSELKVGQAVRGGKVGKELKIELKNAGGEILGALELGERHSKWGHGRYAKFEGQTVLVSDTLDAFDGDGKAWVESKIVDTPYISFNTVVDPAADKAAFGFATGTVARVTVGSDTNRLATIGATVAGGDDRYFKLDGSDWVYTVSKYSVDSLLPKPPPEKKDDKKKDDKKSK